MNVARQGNQSLNTRHMTKGASSSRASFPPRAGRRLGRTVSAIVVLMASLLAGVGPAATAPPHATKFSEYVGPLMTYTWQDCTITVGPAFDDLHIAPNYHFIGAGSVACVYGHNIAITVRQYRDSNGSAPGGSIREVGDPGARETHWTSWVWVATGAACKGGSARSEFYARAYVTIDGHRLGWLPGYMKATSDGCLNYTPPQP